MHYEINVSRNGQHYFATAERSIVTEDKAKQVVDHFRAVFPAALGFSVTVSRITTTSEPLEPAALRA